MNDDKIIETSVRNLLCHCGGATPGQRVLVAYEPPEFGFFDAEVAGCVARTADRLGFEVHTTCVDFQHDAPCFPSDLMAQMQANDVVVFLARIGDQLRFSQMPPELTIINSYTLNKHLLESCFASADYRAFVALKSAVDRHVAGAESIVMTCPAGTRVEGTPNLAHVPASDTSLRRFPMSVFSPVPAQDFSGQVALGGFLTGTGSRYYEDYTVEFEGQTFAKLQNGRLTGFEGARKDVARAEAQYDRVSRRFNLDRDFVHSWHAGIHPGCGFPWDRAENNETWGGAAFGNPRILHFHTCGAYAPGEISWNVFDPTIEIDGIALWQEGRFMPHLLAEGADILETYPCAAACFANPDRAVGLGDC